MLILNLIWIMKAQIHHEGCQVCITKPDQLLHRTSPIAIKTSFQGVKIVFWWGEAFCFNPLTKNKNLWQQYKSSPILQENCVLGNTGWPERENHRRNLFMLMQLQLPLWQCVELHYAFAVHYELNFVMWNGACLDMFMLSILEP